MRLENIKFNLFQLIKQGHKWQHTNIMGNGERFKLYFSPAQLLAILIAVAGIFLLKKGFSSDFVGYAITALSIFIGLFLSVILIFYDKYRKDGDIRSDENMSDDQKLTLIKKRNFIKQFISLTSYSMLLSLLCIFLLSLDLAHDIFSTDIRQFSPVHSWVEINFVTFCNFLVVVLVIIQRLAATYFLLDFAIIVLYAVSGLHQFLITEHDSPSQN